MPPGYENAMMPDGTMEGLPPELNLLIAGNLLPEDIWATAQTNHWFIECLTDNILWRNIFKLHFPHLYAKYAEQENIWWYDKFLQARKVSYSNLDNIEKHLFSLAKQGFLAELSKYQLDLATLMLRDSEGWTLYDWIIRSALQPLLDVFFIKFREDFNKSKSSVIAKDRQGRTLLHWAVQNNQPLQVIKQMVTQAGYNVKARDQAGDTPLALAAKYGFLELAKFLWMQELKVGQLITNRNRLLPLAIFGDHIDLVKFFLTMGLSPNEKSALGVPPLFIAAQEGNLDLVTFLLDNGADANAVYTPNGASALYVAVQNGHFKIAKALLSKEADVNLACKNGVTPLLIAVQKGNMVVINLLLAYGASFDATILATGQTVFDMAAALSRLDIVDLLNNEVQKRTHLYFQQGISFFSSPDAVESKGSQVIDESSSTASAHLL